MTKRIKLTKAQKRYLELARDCAESGKRGALVGGTRQAAMVGELVSAGFLELVDIVSFVEGKRCENERPVFALTEAGRIALATHGARGCAA